MLKRLFFAIFMAVFVMSSAVDAKPADVGIATTGQMVNVEYIHKYIKQKWDIDIAYSPKLDTPMRVANME